MKATTGKALGLITLGAVLVGSLVVSGRGEQRALRQFMRQKLDHSQRLLEGLTREDYGPIAQSAKAMKELSEDAQWRASPHVDYIR